MDQLHNEIHENCYSKNIDENPQYEIIVNVLPFVDHFVVAAVVDDVSHAEILSRRTLHGISQEDGPGVTGNVGVTVSTYLTEPPLYNTYAYKIQYLQR